MNRISIPSVTMSKSRAPLALGAAALGSVGYYLYQAGGQPKVAEKKFESRSLRGIGALTIGWH